MLFIGTQFSNLNTAVDTSFCAWQARQADRLVELDSTM